MSILVLKFGGTSVGSVDLIKSAAQIIKKEYDLGHNIAVVVSAMSGTTNKLIENINLINSENKNAHDDAEYDAIVASGEQITSGLMALALKDLNIDARSWLGWQLPIYTSGNHRHSVISKIEDEKIINGFKNRQVAVVAGFQGVGSDGRITTIGRGGSDNTAVFLASALNAERCDIYTDVNGVYTTDPRMADNVKRLNKISYEEMIEMSSQGAKVLQTSSVESAINHNVKVQVRSTFHPDDMGTVISDEVMNNESKAVSGVAYSKDEAKITVIGLVDQPGIAATIFNALSNKSINVDMIVQNNFIERKETNLTFTVPVTDLDQSVKILDDLKSSINYEKVISENNLSKVSIIGAGMRNQPGIAAKMFDCLSKNNINIEVISTSEIKISVLIDMARTEEAVRSLHQIFELDKL
ncbi:aspartate kinase [Pelagibacteraceae bacterium]|jgi:aspartate kinase|nr:aspartate kinase [Pelagibacteraceae bacterium]|tara:strand:+ start:1847 stop:3082 length:1236 start_codon:yes stop_codon:yes gene_type:complete